MFQVKPLSKIWLSLFLSLSLISCQTITVKTEGQSPLKLSGSPDYEESQDFFLWGLAGEAVIPTEKICGDRGVAQLQSQTSFLDQLWPILIGVASAGVFMGLGFLAASDEEADGGFDYSQIQEGSFGVVALLAPMLAAGIYTPKTAKVWCAKGSVEAEEGEEAI